MIDILMATYNGDTYLREQLDSILQQSYPDWRLIVRDDGSTDTTVTIVKEYQANNPGQIILLCAETPSGSAKNNFFQLIQYWKKHCHSKYVMFCDQDDVWLPQKIQKTLEKMKQLEQQYGKNIPLLVHTDLMVVDETLKEVCPSLFVMQRMDARRDQLHHIVVQNIVTGCTMMVNCSLLQRITTIPQHAMMHDMWLALIAAAFGYIGFVPVPMIFYRQHASNANGAKDVKSWRYFWWKLTGVKEIHEQLVRQYRQAEEFLQIYQKELSLSQKRMLQAYSHLENASLWKKVYMLTKYQLYKKGIVRVVGQILC